MTWQWLVLSVMLVTFVYWLERWMKSFRAEIRGRLDRIEELLNTRRQ